MQYLILQILTIIRVMAQNCQEGKSIPVLGAREPTTYGHRTRYGVQFFLLPLISIIYRTVKFEHLPFEKIKVGGHALLVSLVIFKEFKD